jgi:hypothetical protein
MYERSAARASSTARRAAPARSAHRRCVPSRRSASARRWGISRTSQARGGRRARSTASTAAGSPGPQQHESDLGLVQAQMQAGVVELATRRSPGVARPRNHRVARWGGRRARRARRRARAIDRERHGDSRTVGCSRRSRRSAIPTASRPVALRRERGRSLRDPALEARARHDLVTSPTRARAFHACLLRSSQRQRGRGGPSACRRVRPPVPEHARNLPRAARRPTKPSSTSRISRTRAQLVAAARRRAVQRAERPYRTRGSALPSRTGSRW